MHANRNAPNDAPRHDAGRAANEAEGRAGRTGGDLAGDIALGALAGAVGVWVMDRVDWFMYDHEDPQARRRTEEARPGGLDPAHVAASRAAGAFGRTPSPEQPNAAGMAVHYALGIGPGALYGALRDRVPYVGAGRGTLWGFGLFALQDEVLNSAAGLSGRPGAYPWQAHARGVVAHLVYGAVTDIAFGLMKRGLRKG